MLAGSGFWVYRSGFVGWAFGFGMIACFVQAGPSLCMAPPSPKPSSEERPSNVCVKDYLEVHG